MTLISIKSACRKFDDMTPATFFKEFILSKTLKVYPLPVSKKLRIDLDELNQWIENNKSICVEREKEQINYQESIKRARMVV